MNKKLLSGQAIPIAIAHCARREWRMNGVMGARLLDCEQQHENEVGYEFDWGQLIEDVADPSDNPLEFAELGNLVSWSFRLNELHAEFLDAGGYLEELSDTSMRLLEEMAEQRTWPHYIQLWDGDDLSTFEMVVFGDRNIVRARNWILKRFFREWLPPLISALRELNALPRRMR